MGEFKFNFEITREGMAEAQALKDIPRAHKKILTEWLGGVKFLAMRNAKAMTKSTTSGLYKTNKTKGKKSGQLANNIGIDVQGADDNFTGLIGTGVKGTKSVKYAKIQDEGGTTHPQITDKMRRFAWAMFFAANTKRSKATGAYMWFYLAISKKSQLTVNILASHWFTGAIETNRPLLDEMMKPENAFRYAMRMRGN